MPDRWVVRAVVISLALIALAVIVGAIALSIGNHVIPEALWTIAGTAVGAVAGILAKTNTEPAPLQPVQVMNQPAAPVPVEPTPPETESTVASSFPSATARKAALGIEKRAPRKKPAT